jgi:hypothetical protein
MAGGPWFPGRPGFVECGFRAISKCRHIVHYRRVPGDPVFKRLGNHMRKAALLLAVLLAASLSTSADAAKKKAAAKPDPAIAAQANTAKLMGAAMNPGAVKAEPAKPAKKKMAKKKKGKKAAKKKM